MIKTAINTYHKAKFGMIKEFAKNSNEIIDEAKFYDDGYLTVKINNLKKDLQIIMSDLATAIEFEKKNKITSKKIEDLNVKKEILMVEMCFYASNSFNSLDMCRDMVANIDHEFIDCIEALIAYRENRIEDAFKLFHKYFTNTESIPHHYLINKIYGTILMSYNQDNMAIKLLREAASRKPEDVEVHKKLYQLYKKNNLLQELEIEKMIIDLLGGYNENYNV